VGSLEFGGAFLVFSVMGCVSLVLFFFLHMKNRALVKLPENLHVEVFDRTFNVFDPYPEHGGVLHSFLILLPVVALVGALTVAYLALMILAMGLALALAAFIFCLALMMFDETFEIYENAGKLVKAFDNCAGLGVGDLVVLSVLKRIMPKLRAYYLLLSVAFFGSSVALPYVVPAAIMTLAQVASALISSSAPAEVLSAYITVLVFAAAEVIIYVVARKAKSRILGFPSTQSLISAISGEGYDSFALSNR
jgi:hypothetical protein